MVFIMYVTYTGNSNKGVGGLYHVLLIHDTVKRVPVVYIICSTPTSYSNEDAGGLHHVFYLYRLQ